MENVRSSSALTAPVNARLGRNAGRYFGETIAIETVMEEQRHWACAHGWQVEDIAVTPQWSLPAFRRAAPVARRRQIYLSAGIHGDEPAGPLAVRELLRDNLWPEDAEIWLCACLNPTGFPLNTRESAAGLDLNRDYQSLRSAEICAHVAWLQRQPVFDVTFCLHEDWEAHGFYVYELNPDHRPSRAPRMIEAARAVCPIDTSELIDGREARDGIIRPEIDPALRPEWPEAFYLFQNQTRLGYTLEAPSDFPLPMRVSALVKAVEAALAAE